jgi:hypothetical protein
VCVCVCMCVCVCGGGGGSTHVYQHVLGRPTLKKSVINVVWKLDKKGMVGNWTQLLVISCSAGKSPASVSNCPSRGPYYAVKYGNTRSIVRHNQYEPHR